MTTASAVNTHTHTPGMWHNLCNCKEAGAAVHDEQRWATPSHPSESGAVPLCQLGRSLAVQTPWLANTLQKPSVVREIPAWLLPGYQAAETSTADLALLSLIKSSVLQVMFPLT